jgi:hypothetical protein
MATTPLHDRVLLLETDVKDLLIRISKISEKLDGPPKQPFSVVGTETDKSAIRPSDIGTGLGQISGGPVIWNDSELNVPPYGEEPPLPNTGYNKHSHSRFSGGALINGILEIVEYVWEGITNKNCPQYWNPQPKIATMQNSKKQTVEKIGPLELVFNPDIKKWGTPSYEIDIHHCYIVERDEDGELVKDDKGQEKKSPLYNQDWNKTSIIWDAESKVWRFFAVYAPGDPSVGQGGDGTPPGAVPGSQGSSGGGGGGGGGGGW